MGSPVVRDCGCIEQSFSDETSETKRCVAHGLIEAAQHGLRQNNALGNVGMRLLDDARDAKMQDLSDAADRILDEEDE